MSELDETTDDTTPTVDPADEATEGASPVDDPSSSAESTTEEETDAEETPEQVVEREKKERQAARVKAADDAEKASAARREKRKKELEWQEREERASAREREATEAVRRAKALIDELEAKKQAIAKGGYEGLKALGVDYGDWTRKTLEETSPETLAQRAMQEAREAKEEIRRRDEMEARRKQETEAAERQSASEKRFEDYIDQNADDFPDASKLTARMTHLLAGEAAAEYRRENGHWPSFTALLPRLDKKAKDFHDEQQQRSAKRARPGDSPSDGAPKTQATPGQPASTPANRTLTPATAVTKARPPRTMTAEEEDEWALAELRQAMAADTKQAKSA